SHDRPLSRVSDILRDADFFDADLDVVRFATESVALDPDSSMRRLGAAIARQQRRLDTPKG
ncbi:MAG: hypothetical protein Q7T55_01940, partial [Solirubrobacteraceae bacterium]|nr:hypothetical protein [Solirubrobacteraceae bacterium]